MKTATDTVVARLTRGGTRRPTRRIRSLLALTAGALLVLPGCGFVNTSSSAPAGKSISIAVSSEQHAALAQLIPAFEKESGVKVTETFAATADLNEQIRIQLTSKTAPDVFRVSPGSSSPIAAKILGKSGDLSTLTGTWTSQIPPAVTDLSAVDGQTKAYPLSQNAIVMAYNKEVFTRLGLKPPSTWTEFLAVCDKLKSAGVTPVSAGFTGGIYLQFLVYQLAADIVYSKGDVNAQMESGQVTFSSSPQWKEVFTKFAELQKRGYFTKGANGVTGDQAAQAVGTGKAGMISVVSTLVPKGDVGVFALPATDDAAETRIPVAPDFLGVNANGKNPDAARQLIDFLARPENATAYAAAANSLPSLSGATAPDNATLKPVLGLISDGKTASYANYLWPNGDTQQRLLQSGQQLITGDIDVDTLLEQLSTEYAKGSK